MGASTEKIQEKTLYIVIEYCEKGNLQNYLRKCKGSFINQVINNEIKTEDFSHEKLSSSGDDIICTADLIRWSYQVAHGMQYLASKKVIHADLAARNVLIDSRGNGKITDFGLSRRLFDYSQYVKKKQQPLPYRWMAIECLQQLKFSTQSDIWAYGILLWEIYSVGDMPYPGVDWGAHFLKQLLNGERLVKPAYSTHAIYNLMRSCWNAIPEERATFDDLAQYFTTLLGTLLYVELEAVAEDTESNPIDFMDSLNQSQS